MGWQAERHAINSVFAYHNVRARVRRTIETPATIFHLLEKQPEARVDDVAGVIEELKLALSEQRMAKIEVRFTSPPMVLEVPHPRPRPILLPRVLPNKAYQMLCGRSFGSGRGEFQILDLRASPHTLIAGITGSGKSMLGKVMALSLALQTSPADLHLYVVDMKLDDFVVLRNLPHTRMFGDEDEADAVIGAVADVSRARRRSVGVSGPRVLLLIDEKARLSKEGLAMVGELLALGRSQAINVVSATQHPTTAILGGAEGKVNYTTRLVGRVIDASASSTASGVPKLGAEKLAGPGSFVRVDHVVGVERFQGFLVHDPEEFAERVRARWGAFGVPVHRKAEAWPVTDVEGRSEAKATVQDKTHTGGIPHALRAIFEKYDDGHGGMKRGGLAEAMRALYGAEARTSGAIYQEQRGVVLAYLERWLGASGNTAAETSEDSSEPPLPSGKSAENEILPETRSVPKTGEL